MPVAPSTSRRRPADVAGVPSVEWIVATQRTGYQVARNDRARMVKYIQAHGLAAVLEHDIADLEGLNVSGLIWVGRRKRARRAQRILREYHQELTASISAPATGNAGPLHA